MDPTVINERLALLTAEMQQVRLVVGQLVESSGETTAGLVALDKNHAVSDAKSDLRAERLVKLEEQINQLATDLASVAGPVHDYFETQNRTRAQADANRVNLLSYLTPARIALFSTAFLSLSGGLGYTFATQHVTSAPTTVQTGHDAGKVPT